MVITWRTIELEYGIQSTLPYFEHTGSVIEVLRFQAKIHYGFEIFLIKWIGGS